METIGSILYTPYKDGRVVLRYIVRHFLESLHFKERCLCRNPFQSSSNVTYQNRPGCRAPMTSIMIIRVYDENLQKVGYGMLRDTLDGKKAPTHRPHSSSFWGFMFRIL